MDDGRVTRLRTGAGDAAATVVGTFPYDVRLRREGGELACACTCPAAEDGSFCKHLVALGLALGERLSGEDSEAAGPGKGGPAGMEALRTHLSRKPAEELVELLLEVTRDDPRLEDRFRLEMAREGAGGPDLWTYRRVIDETTAAHDFVHYRASFDYARGVEEAIQGIADLLEKGHAAAVIELAEHALARLEDALERIDDSSGLIRPIMDELEALHLAACQRASPDPEALARRLFEREVTSDWEVFYQAVVRYRDVLGHEGLQAYRTLAAERWAQVPALGPGERDPGRYGSRFRITSIMEALAEADGDLEAMVGVMARDLSSPYGYLRIAEVLAEGGEEERALEWAERGIAESERRDGRLTAFVAEAYQRRGRAREAVSLMWEEFADRPRLDSYAALREHAERAEVWPEWRGRAVELLRGLRDRSELVRVLLREDDAEAAWEEALEGGCTEDLWLRLAEARAEDHPAEAIPIYRRAVERAIERKNKRGYREAVETMAKVGDLMRRTEEPDRFAEYVKEIRARHARKRSLMKLLDARPEWAEA